MRRPSAPVLVVLAVIAIAGCGATPSISTLERQLEKDISDQLMVSALSGGFPPNASVSCPKHASLKRGSTFVCSATIEQTRTDQGGTPGAISPSGSPSVQYETRKVKVTMLDDSGKAHWELESP